MSFDGSSAVAIQKAQSIMKKPGIKNQLHDTKMEEIYYKFAPITSCEVERSFSKYKSILVDNRQCFKVENLEQYLVCNVNT
jgi:hypothetical protein